MNKDIKYNIENLSEEEYKLVDNLIKLLSNRRKKEIQINEDIIPAVDDKYKICNELLSGETDYIINNYFTTIALFMESIGEVKHEQKILFSRMVKGNNGDVISFIVNAKRMNDNNLYNYLDSIKDNKIKYRLIIDCMIIAGCGEISNESLKLISDYANILLIEREEVEFLASISKSILMQNHEQYWECKLNNTTCIDSCIADEYMQKEQSNLKMKYEKASKAFCDFNNEIAMPLLCELVDEGMYEVCPLLYWIYCDDSKFASYKNAEKCLKIGYEHGDAISSMLYALTYDYVNEEIAENFYPKVKKLAEQGNIYAEYALGIVDITSVCGDKDYSSAANHFINAYSKGLYRGACSMFSRIKNGDEPFSRDWVSAEIWGNQVLKYDVRYRGCFKVALTFMCIDDYGCCDEKKQKEFYCKAADIWEKLIDLGVGAAATNLGWMYDKGLGRDVNLKKAFYYYQIAADMGDDVGQCNLANFYEYGKGTEKNIEEAKKWYKKSAEQGYRKAIDKLAEL